jgi:arylsulfatase A-like enzyme
MARRWSWCALLLPLLLLVACGSEPVRREVGPNLLLVVIDTCRADRTSLHGYELETTPHLARLGREGVRFDQAVTHVPQTLPAVATLLTGRLPHRHGVRVNGLFRLSEDVVTLPGVLSDEGFVTAAIVSAFPLDARFGVAQGFGHFDADFRESVLTHARREGLPFQGRRYRDFEQRADEATDKALAWLNARSDAERQSPFFLMVHYFDPHWPYEPPEGFRHFADPYDGEIAFTDAQIGRLLEELARMGALEETLVVVTADHGELLDPARPRARHAGYLEEPVLHVPLLLRQPGAVPAGTRVAEPVGLVDLAPTLLELLSVAVPASFEGRSRRDLVFGALDDPGAIVPIETLFFSLEVGRGPARYGARGPNLTYVHNVHEEDGERRVVEELYDRRRDPEQRSNLLAQPGSAREHARELEALRRVAQPLAGPARSAEAVPLTPDVEERLRALGYLAP